MRLSILSVILLCALAGLSACQKESAPPPAAEAPPAAQTAPAPAPEPAAPPAAAPAAPAPADNLIREPVPADQAQPAQAIQTKIGPKESVVNLTSAKVTGQILTVEFVVVPKKKADGKYEWITYGIPMKNISYIDDATAKKVSLLQDDSGGYMASPQNSQGDDIRLDSNAPIMVTLKFPAPPETSPTVSVNFSKVGSFDGVPVSR